jgi:hypothetical protein
LTGFARGACGVVLDRCDPKPCFGRRLVLQILLEYRLQAVSWARLYLKGRNRLNAVLQQEASRYQERLNFSAENAWSQAALAACSELQVGRRTSWKRWPSMW